MLKYRVRPAELNDLALCLEIDASFVTTYVWQLQESFDEPEEADEQLQPHQRILGKPGLITPPSFRMELSPSRLPRPLAVSAPMNDQQLLAEWKKTDYLLVAEATANPDPSAALPDEAEAGENLPLLASNPDLLPDILGYVGLAVDGARHIAWVNSMAVQLDYRRRGVGTQLLSEARAWADRYRLRSLMVEVQTKNYPAIAFLQKNGFFFCGYNNAFYPTREIALFFARRLEKFS